MKLKIAEVKKGGTIVARAYHDDSSSATAWFEKEYPKDHTLEILDNLSHAREIRRETIKKILDDDDFKDIIIALARANPGVIPEDIKDKVQAALDV